jgi:uncharacterized protein (TIGR02145 family)
MIKMKSIITLFALVLAANALSAQNYYISFAATGDTTEIESIKVENLTQNTFVNLSKDDVLHLSSTVGIRENTYTSAGNPVIYPNPMVENARVEFVTSLPGEVKLSLYNIEGKRVAGNDRFLEQGRQVYELRTAQKGLYILQIEEASMSSYARFISLSESGSAHVEFIDTYREDEIVKALTEQDASKGTFAEIIMQYNTGDRIRYIGKSKYYYTVFADVPATSKTVTFTFAKCTDYDKNQYKVVNMGSQIWMAENLKSTTYSDGTSIPFVNTNVAWDALTATDKAYCYYDDNILNKDTYGVLYTWSAAMKDAASSNASPSNVQGVCPAGWHLPSDAEWHTMVLTLDASALLNTTESGSAGGKMKEYGISHWVTPNTGATNSSGFSALPAGRRMETGVSTQLGYNTMWWSSTDASGNARDRTLYYNAERIDRAPAYRNVGYSVRCIKNY